LIIRLLYHAAPTAELFQRRTGNAGMILNGEQVDKEVAVVYLQALSLCRLGQNQGS
jgi:hypothetical protein